MLKRKSSVAVLASAALLGEMFSAYSMFSLMNSPSVALSMWPVVWTAAVFTLSLLVSIVLAVRGITVMGSASVAAAGLGFLASGITGGETTQVLMGLVCIVAGLSFTFVLARFSISSLCGQLALHAVAGGEPRERRTRLCRITDLDQRLLPLLEDTVHAYSLGDLRAATKLCCETRYADEGVLPRGSSFAGPPPVVEACVLTENLVIVLIAHTEGRGVALVGRLQQTMVTEPSRPEDGTGAREVYVRSAWLDSIESSSYPFPLDDSAVGREFVQVFRGMLTATRHT
ncbi:hypothetical protein [Streptomyces venezuelae]|uniref:hypothetical protein n=1 Tax=Streptomyces venezuelae TaxID=54571 RepID=UPI003322D8CF